MTPPNTSAGRNWLDAEIDAYKKDVDRTLLRENLKLTVTERFQKHRRVAQFAEKLRNAGKRARGEQ
jgi:hypothetical protein